MAFPPSHYHFEPKARCFVSMFHARREGSTLRAPSSVFLAATALCCAFVVEAQGEREPLSSHLVLPVSAELANNNSRALSVQVQPALSGYALPGMAGGEATHSGTSPLNDGGTRLEQGSANALFGTRQGGANLPSAVAPPTQRIHCNPATLDGCATSLPFPAFSTESAARALQTEVPDALSPRADAAGPSRGTIPMLYARPHTSLETSPLFALVSLPPALSHANPVRSLPYAGFPGYGSSPQTPAAPNGLQSTLSSAPVRAFSLISGATTNPYIASILRPHEAYRPELPSETLGGMVQPESGPLTSVTATSDAVPAVPANSRKLLRGQRKAKGATEGLGILHRRFSSSDNLDDTEVHPSKATSTMAETVHTPTERKSRIIHSAHQHCSSRGMGASRSQLASSGRKSSKKNVSAWCNIGGNRNAASSQLEALLTEDPLGNSETSPSVYDPRYVGYSVAGQSEPRALQERRQDTSQDVLSNAGEPAALNYAFMRGFGKPRTSTFFGGPVNPPIAPVVPPGLALVQYTSNPALPLWGPIPNFPLNFSTL